MTGPNAAYEALVQARAEYDAALSAAVMASHDLEAAHQQRDPAVLASAREKVNAAHGAEAEARALWLAASQQVRPTFEALLADPFGQYDKDGEVLSALLNWREPPLCMTRMEVRSNTAFVGAVVPSSVYLCTNRKPCDVHAKADQVAPGDES